ncbi:hypothetical protein DSECCO2_182360 [anaerobic digester metagenome]
MTAALLAAAGAGGPYRCGSPLSHLRRSISVPISPAVTRHPPSMSRRAWNRNSWASSSNLKPSRKTGAPMRTSPKARAGSPVLIPSGTWAEETPRSRQRPRLADRYELKETTPLISGPTPEPTSFHPLSRSKTRPRSTPSLRSVPGSWRSSFPGTASRQKRSMEQAKASRNTNSKA